MAEQSTTLREIKSEWEGVQRLPDTDALDKLINSDLPSRTAHVLTRSKSSAALFNERRSVGREIRVAIMSAGQPPSDGPDISAREEYLRCTARDRKVKQKPKGRLTAAERTLPETAKCRIVKMQEEKARADGFDSDHSRRSADLLSLWSESRPLSITHVGTDDDPSTLDEAWGSAVRGFANGKARDGVIALIDAAIDALPSATDEPPGLTPEDIDFLVAAVGLGATDGECRKSNDIEACATGKRGQVCPRSRRNRLISSGLLRSGGNKGVTVTREGADLAKKKGD